VRLLAEQGEFPLKAVGCGSAGINRRIPSARNEIPREYIMVLFIEIRDHAQTASIY
jgi:hypothetical protein